MNYQNKQILYPKFISRLFGTTIDLFLLPFICTPIMHILSRYVFIYIFKDFFIQNQIPLSDTKAISEIVTTQEFMSSITAGSFMSYIAILMLLNMLLTGIFFVTFWKYKGATPGKMLMHMRIVDADTLDKPSTFQLIKRFLGYLTAPFGIWSILFNSRGQALHDKMSNTVVVKV